MSLISVREYGKLHIGEFDAARPAVTCGQAALLTDLKATYGFEVFKYINGTTLAAQQYVGVFQLGPHTVEVLPKVDGNAPNVRRNLVAMLAIALDLDISEGDVARVATQNHGVLEILIRLFCDKLFAQVHRGLVRRYEGREENLSVLRGKLGVVEQVRLNAANPERLFCRFDEFQEDNPLNQVLKAAIRLLLKVSRELKNQRQLAELLLVFEGASECPRTSLPWNRVVFDRMSDRYKPCYKLAELFLKMTPPDVSGGGMQGFSLFFDMNVLFEEYIGRMAVRVFGPLGYRVTLQGPQQYLAFDENLKRPAFAMKPDVVGSLNSKTAWILDTKWKRLSMEEAKDGVAQSDLYQMYAYANCYCCPDVVLLYPHHKELGPVAGIRGNYSLNPWLLEVSNRESRRVRVATINLENLKTVPAQLRQLFLPENSATEAVSP
ncbi:McrBC 5-methylcytosine restriction system component [Sulfuricella sp. T08]|uniref:McrC family protein n=1 Tax=Sulfuricella sp. T08 TaxID=1632857 RepID=UPI00061795DC|nr:McrC family protein [Sulfuricella sp. T08]GAO35625.1 McrBC 5-methylcytosine restriction system component [Sulfuricella sp. T08]